MTKWFTVSEKLPAHNQKILIRDGDSITVAVYDEKNKTFQLRNGDKWDLNQTIRWMELLLTKDY
jgi:hypothetical protein